LNLKNVIVAVAMGSPAAAAWAQSDFTIYGVLDVDVASYRMNGNLGRENAATFWNRLVFDPFNAVGPGASTNVGLGSLTATAYRAQIR
jgi:hypothetical protein